MRRYWNPTNRLFNKEKNQLISEKAFTPVKEINTQNTFAVLEDNEEGQDNNRTKKLVQEEEVDHFKENNKSIEGETLKQKKQHPSSTKDWTIHAFANYQGKRAGNNNKSQNKPKKVIRRWDVLVV